MAYGCMAVIHRAAKIHIEPPIDYLYIEVLKSPRLPEYSSCRASCGIDKEINAAIEIQGSLYRFFDLPIITAVSLYGFCCPAPAADLLCGRIGSLYIYICNKYTGSFFGKPLGWQQSYAGRSAIY
jgi:hypothetical protein